MRYTRGLSLVRVGQRLQVPISPKKRIAFSLSKGEYNAQCVMGGRT